MQLLNGFSMEKIFSQVPVFFARHAWFVFLAGAAVVLMAGSIIFYTNGWQVAQNDYEAQISITSVNSVGLGAAKAFLQERAEEGDAAPSDNPFIFVPVAE